MKKYLLGAVSSLALTGAPAFAADMPYYSAPPVRYAPPPIYTWTGFYVGVNVGGTWSISPFVKPSQSVGMLPASIPLDYNIAAVAATTAAMQLKANDSGFIGGAQVGYDWQAGNGGVVGVEADAAGFSTIRSRGNSALIMDVPGGGGFQIGAFTTGSRSLNFLGTLRLRAGWLALPTLLVYATGGFAYGQVSGDYGVTQAYFPPPLSPYMVAAWTGQGAYSKIATGWTLGFGTEWMIYPGVSIKGEYLYYSLGSIQTPATIQRDPTSLPVFGPAWQNVTRSYASYNGHIFRVGLNIRFSDYGPLAAPVKGPIYARY
ncbi:outer membrane protein [Methylocystis sp. JAN1]|uniref:outer membrane protein n=1 Tax=Methylocystis sp. JAN1 TaxID=3397211 RepID=UPI003FA2E058